jgi:A/G-specific adenine glycosylase
MPLLNAPGAVSSPLLKWYDRHRRVLPWRALPDQAADPYKVWLSEIMLQQTTVQAVGPYFQAFVARWPTVRDLAAAPVEDLLAAWAGLGYYARARNLHKCAQAVVRDHGDVFPDTEEGLRQLPGIGAYTAGAIAAIAFDRKAAAVDGNVERVVARLFAITTPLPNAKPELRAHTAGLVPDSRAGDFAQAMMDLGATICTPRKPACVLCPLTAMCEARRLGIASELPARAEKKKRPLRRAVAFWIERETADGTIEVMLRRRPPHGLLGGMLEIPVTDWKRDAAADDEGTLAQSPVRAKNWRTLPGIVRHGFTHFELETTVLATRISKGAKSPPDAIWTARDTLDTAGLPTVMWKVVKHVAERGGE